jgi:small-conductance mechanosensitive channel
VTDRERFYEIRHAVRMGIKRRFDEMGIEFAFPRADAVREERRARAGRAMTPLASVLIRSDDAGGARPFAGSPADA